MNKCKANFDSATEVLGVWRDDLLTGTPPLIYPVGDGDLTRMEIGPKRVTLLGGAPGAGKTSFTMQIVVDALRLSPSIRACVCNVEMPPDVLLDRQLARLSGIGLSTIRQREFTDLHVDRIEQGISTLESMADRLFFVRPPFDLANVVATVDEVQADIIVLDYIQRISPPGSQLDRRGSVDATMNYIRQFADTGISVIVVAAVARTKDTRGRSSYDGGGLNLASFRESSELEFGADDAFIVVRDDEDEDGVTLRHLKARYSEPTDIRLDFDRRLQRFTSPACEAVADRDPSPSRAAVEALWSKTQAAEDNSAGQ